MRAHIGMVTSVLVLLWSGNVWATIIELPLNCAGTYNRNNPIWEINFDLGVEFTDISHVYIEWEFEIKGAKSVYDDPENPIPKDVMLAIAIGIQPNWRYQYISGGASTYPTHEPFDLTTEISKGPKTWAFLLDGKEYLIISYQEYLFDGYYIESGAINLNNAILIIDGTLVPEPIALIFLSFGSAGLLLRKKRKLS